MTKLYTAAPCGCRKQHSESNNYDYNRNSTVQKPSEAVKKRVTVLPGKQEDDEEAVALRATDLVNPLCPSLLFSASKITVHYYTNTRLPSLTIARTYQA